MNGMLWKKILMGVLGLVVALFGVVVQPASAAVNDFEISRYDMTLRLGRDVESRSLLTTEETIVAQFPSYDQNHGIERAIPKRYDGHSTSLKIVSVTDEKGTPREFTTYDDDQGNEVVRIGNAETYVHGTQTYRLVYSQRDVTKRYMDTSADEFYWDTNGTFWRVPINQLNVTVEVEPSLASSLSGKSSCYLGGAGSKDVCQFTGKTTKFTTSAKDLRPGENISVAIGFSTGTFSEYTPSLVEKVVGWWVLAQVALSVVAAVVVVAASVWLYRRRNRPGELGTIVPQYLPPADVSVSTAALVAKGQTRSAIPAQWIDLAVRHYLKMYQIKDKSLFRPAEFEVELVRNPNDLKWEERELLQDSFLMGTSLQVGSRLNFASLKKDSSYAQRLQSNKSILSDKVKKDYGLRSEDENGKQVLRRWSGGLLIGSFILLSPPLIIAASAVFGLSWYVWPLTDKGLALRRYLLGLKQYITVAEQERLQMLQSPEGASKGGSAPVDEKQLITLYERVLPYAVLFGQEKQWNKQLGVYYEQAGTSPDWYSGQSGLYNAAAFSSAMSSFSSLASYGTSSSSDSGGSSGGGSSGGGGGGGGGGGW